VQDTGASLVHRGGVARDTWDKEEALHSEQQEARGGSDSGVKGIVRRARARRDEEGHRSGEARLGKVKLEEVRLDW